MSLFNQLFKPLALIAITVSISSCYSDQLPDQSDNLPTNVSFSKNIQPIFDQNCVACHPGVKPPDLRPGESYNDLISKNLVIPNDAAGSVLYKTLIGDGAPQMPTSGPLSQSKINYVKQWIAEGAKNN